MASVQYWDVKDVENWLKNNGFSPYVEQLCKKHALNGCSLLMLQEDNFKSNEMKSLGDHKRLLMGIHELCAQNPEAQNQYLKSQPEGVGELALVAEEDNKCSIFVGEVEEKSLEGKQLKPEYVKVFVSYLYMSMASLAASMVVAIAHDRTPDRKQHPPLPDLILDNLPLIPIAFELSEMVALTLACISLLVIFFHKHRSEKSLSLKSLGNPNPHTNPYHYLKKALLLTSLGWDVACQFGEVGNSLYQV